LIGSTVSKGEEKRLLRSAFGSFNSDSVHLPPILTDVSSMAQIYTNSSDKHALSQLILNHECEVNSYDREIAKRRGSIALLETRKNGALKTMAKLRTFLSPIHKLPTELLTRVFMGILDYPERWYGHRRRMAFILSHVCQRWRDVSLSFPTLWTSLYLLEADWHASGLADIVTCYMVRSQNHPLTLNLGLPNKGDLHGGRLRPALEVLVRHSARWQSLTISGCPIRLLDHPVFYTIKNQLPLLQHLDFQQLHTVRHIATDYDVFSDCPRLSTIRMEWLPSYVQEGPLLSEMQLPWSQVRTWKVSVREFTTLMSRPCKRLKTLCIRDLDQDDPEDFSVNEKLVSKISSLKLEGCGMALLSLLDATSFPHLSSLDISSYKPILNAPLLDSLARITCLNLNVSPDLLVGSAEIVSLLRQTPMLHTFCLGSYFSDSVLSQEFFGSLTLSHERILTPTPLLPALENFTLWLSRVPEADAKAILDMLTSRWLPDPDYAKLVGAASLKNVTIKLNRDRVEKTFFSSDMPALLDLRAAGMRIDVVCSIQYF
ncbi:hypothetical protein V5O48_017370, partial [Marasmius crinis-equi]